MRLTSPGCCTSSLGRFALVLRHSADTADSLRAIPNLARSARPLKWTTTTGLAVIYPYACQIVNNPVRPSKPACSARKQTPTATARKSTRRNGRFRRVADAWRQLFRTLHAQTPKFKLPKQTHNRLPLSVRIPAISRSFPEQTPPSRTSAHSLPNFLTF